MIGEKGNYEINIDDLKNAPAFLLVLPKPFYVYEAVYNCTDANPWCITVGEKGSIRTIKASAATFADAVTKCMKELK